MTSAVMADLKNDPLRGPFLWENKNANATPSDRDGNKKKNHQEKSKRSCLLRANVKIVQSIERCCGRWGLLVARYPVWAALGCLVLVSALGFGLFNMDIVYRPYDLWVPKGSEFSEVTQWKIEHFPPLYRKQVAILESSNVLTASVIQQIWKLHLQVEALSVQYKDEYYLWKDVCLQFPSNYSTETFTLARNLGYKGYVCYETSLLELFGYNSFIIENLTDEKVLEAVNTVEISKLYGSRGNFYSYLSGIEKNDSGYIYKASATLHTWFTRVDSNAIDKGEYVIDVATGDRVDTMGMNWEKNLVKLIEKETLEGVTINFRAGHTLGEVLRQSITQDIIWIVVGWIVIVIYVIITIGKPLHKEHRIIPAMIGLLSIAFAIFATLGACSLIGIPYGTLTNVLPILLVALGVDDMYVIVTAWDKVSKMKYSDVEKRTQLTMEHAGMAITVTSATDVIAFIVGTSTSLPGLHWFCIYSAVGISLVYILQATLFVASVVVNQKWHDAKLVKKSSFVITFPGSLKDKIPKWRLQRGISMYANILFNPIIKIIVILVTMSLFAFSLYSAIHISKEFDNMWLVPKSSNLFQWYSKIEDMFPHEGEKGVIYFKGTQLPEDIPSLVELGRRLEELPYVVAVDGWFKGLNLQLMENEYDTIKAHTEQEQCGLLLEHVGIKYRSHFRDNEEVKEHPCSLFMMEFQYIHLKDEKSEQLAMSRVRDVIRESNITGYRAAWAHVYSYWETDRVLIKELLQSLSIILSVIFIICLFLLASLRSALLVLSCVVMTLVDVACVVHWWGLTLNTVTSLAYVLAVGICVDYATHIAHDFLVVNGTRNERAKSALIHMGSAVFHGGFSTLLAFLLLAPSDNYIFLSYFKILTGVSVFGLFHALFFLPVMLSLMGPDSYYSSKQTKNYPTIRVTQSSNGLAPQTVISFSRKHTRGNSADIGFYLGINPPSYTTQHANESHLDTRSNSLPCLSGGSFTSNELKDFFLHSSYCTKL